MKPGTKSMRTEFVDFKLEFSFGVYLMPVAREERRKEQQTEQENYVKAVLKTYDTNRSGHLLLFSTLLGVLGRAADVRARLSQGSGSMRQPSPSLAYRSLMIAFRVRCVCFAQAA